MLKKQGKWAGFEATGHADFAQEGSDIVCSAVSALMQTTLLGLTERLHLPVGCEMYEGEMVCVLEQGITAAQYEQAALLLDTMLLGLTSIQSGYGSYLNITQREV